MELVANQKSINVVKEKSDKENMYSIFNQEALQKAMLLLSGSGFKLWCYINKNQSGYTFGLSKVDAIKWGVGSKNSYFKAVDELKKNGYLVETSPNHFNFYEKPKEQKIIITKVAEEEEPQFTF